MAEKVFRSYLQKKGLRFTQERSTILRELAALGAHFDIDGLYHSLRKRRHKVSRASLYRTIPLLVECGLVEEIKTIDTHTYYEYTHGQSHHDHLICMKCGRIIEFYSEKLESLQDEICRRQNFRGSRHMLEIRGYCQRCV